MLMWTLPEAPLLEQLRSPSEVGDELPPHPTRHGLWRFAFVAFALTCVGLGTFAFSALASRTTAPPPRLKAPYGVLVHYTPHAEMLLVSRQSPCPGSVGPCP